MKTLRLIILTGFVMVMVLIGAILNSVLKTFLHSVEVDRQLYGQFRRWLVKAPKTDFINKYETPFFRQFNLNTKTDSLGLCSWLKGKQLGKL